MKKYVTMVGMAALITGCSSVQPGKVTKVSKWKLNNANGYWSLSSDDKCCSKMVKLLSPEDCACEDFSEDAACVSFPAGQKKIEGAEFYRVEMTDASGEKRIYWHQSKQIVNNY